MTKNIKNKPITDEEFQNIMQSDHLLAKLVLNTGVRLNELHRIINTDWNSKDTVIYIKTKKSGDSKNSIILNQDCVQYLINARTKFQGVSVRTLSRTFEKIGINAHRLRSTFACRLMRNGVNIIVIQNLMNHSSLEMTSQYIKMETSQLLTAVETLTNYAVGLEGMSIYECKNEILRLRNRLSKYERSQNGND